ncbi:MAG: hypothetical protein R3E79_17465 [Caldilineaceae bacterium]
MYWLYRAQTATRCSGHTQAGSTHWQAYGSTALYVDIDTSACGHATTPLYLTSLGASPWTKMPNYLIYTVKDVVERF